MSSRNAYSSVVPACDDTQKVSTLKHGNAAGSSSHELGVILHDSGSVDDKVSALDVFAALADENGDPHFSDCVQGLGLIVIGACQVVALAVKDLSKGIHSRAADTDEVDVFFTA